MSRYTKRELAEIKADHEYWDEFGDAIGWKLIGFTGRTHASFDTGRKAIYLPSFTVVGIERDAIMAAIKKEAVK
jgi:hypothetical protein